MTDLSNTPKASQPPAWFSLSGLIQSLQAVSLALYRINQTLGNSYIALAGNNTFTGTNTFNLPIILPTFTVATLPAATTKGQRAQVSDSNATLAAGLGNTVVGGGANFVPVFSDGTNWKIG